MLSGFSKPPWEFTEEDIQELVALKTPEGLHWDYKSSRLLDNRDIMVNDLTKAVSAFNNADGGTIFVGIEERTEGILTFRTTSMMVFLELSSQGHG